MNADYEFLLSPARFKICAYLAVVGEASFSQLKRETGLTDGNLSVQLTKLQAEGFVVSSRQKFARKRPQTLWRLTDKGISALKNFLQWTQKLHNRISQDKRVEKLPDYHNLL